MFFLSPQIDLVFKKLFGTPANEEIVIDFLNAILGRKEKSLITKVIFSDTNNHLKTLEQKFSIVDVRCTDQRGHSYIVEMQIKKQHDFVQRAQYYGACGLDIQLQPTEKYNGVLPVIFIGIVNFPLFKRHKRCLTHHYFTDDCDHERDLNLMEFHFIELPKFKKAVTQLDGLVDKWLFFLKEAHNLEEIPVSLEQDKQLKAAFNVLTQSNWTRQEYELYRRQIDALRVETSVLDTARDDRSLEIARNMLSMNIALDVIAQATGQPLDAIEELLKELKHD